MLEILSIFGLPLMACVLAGGMIAASGIFLIPLGKTLSFLALGQAVTLGRVVANIWELNGPLSIVLSILFYYLMYAIIFFTKGFRSVTEILSIAAYFTLLAISFFLLRLYPSVEFNLLNAFYNDVVSLRQQESIGAIAFFSLSTLVLIICYKYFLKHSFLHAVLAVKRPLSFFLFDLSLILAFFFLGPLFTMSFLLLPGILFGHQMKSFCYSLMTALFIGFGASAGGFILSLEYHRFPTIPAQVILCLSFSMLVALWCRRRNYG